MNKIIKSHHYDVILAQSNTVFCKELLKMKNLKRVYKDKKSFVFIPSISHKTEFIQPEPNEDYYIRTKYVNNINF